MEIVSLVLILLLAVVVSSAVSRMLPIGIPSPLVQIALGAVIGFAVHLRVDLDPEIFLLVFLPPLLFVDGWRIPKDELLKDAPTVVGLALGLVLITVVGLGLFVDWMIPAMPLAVAFALAAVVSPTDPVAVSAIAARVPMPRRMLHILEGESLLNDASGLVCLRFAVAAALTGRFSLGQAGLTFAWVAAGGIAVGVIVTLVITFTKAWVSDRFGEDTGSQILVSLLIPFAAYLAAEDLHCSGILAAVAAGVTMTYAEVSRRSLAATRIGRNSVWDLIQFALNGIMFVLLGEQLPVILGRAGETVRITGHSNPWWLGGYVLAIIAVLALLRFAWVWLSFRLTLLRRGRRAAAGNPDWRLFAAMSFAGVRGAITLAGVLTIPLTLTDGTAFPGRDLAIFLATGVILVSLLLASVLLPMVLRGLSLPAEPSHQVEEQHARLLAAEAAIREVEHARPAPGEGQVGAESYAAIGTHITDRYRERIAEHRDAVHDQEGSRDIAEVERKLRLVALAAERNAIFSLVRAQRIGSHIGRKLIREIDLAEERLET